MQPKETISTWVSDYVIALYSSSKFFAPARRFSRIFPPPSAFAYDLDTADRSIARCWVWLAQVCAADSHPPIGMHGQAKGARNAMLAPLLIATGKSR